MPFDLYLQIFGGMIIDLLVAHLLLFFVAFFAAAILGIVFGILVHRLRSLRVLVPVVNVLQATPEIVLLAISIPLLGIGYTGALVPLFVKGVLPVMQNTTSGLHRVDETLKEAARGMGMSDMQVLFRVELAQAIPVIIAGMRVSAVMLVSVITLTAYIGVESLGTLILQGIARMDANALFVGSGLAALIAIIFNQLLIWAERYAARAVGASK